jgi:CheY-like chemotaxis protein
VPRKLLLADDSVTVQRVVELTFAEEGIQVVPVGDGHAAVRQAAEDPPDVVLADVSMPGLDGYQVAERIKGDPRLAHVPVILMTGAFEPLDEARARTVRCDAILAKPFEPQMVVALVRQLLEGGIARPDALTPPGETGDAALRPSTVTRESAAAFAQRSEGAMGVTRDLRGGGVATSLDEYLGRLDEALTSASAPVETPLAAPAASSSPAPADAPAAPAAAPGVDERGPGASRVADAFSALLAEELGERALPEPWSRFAGRPQVTAMERPGAERRGAVPSEPVSPPVVSTEPAADDPAEPLVTVPPAPRRSEPLSEADLDDIARRVAARLGSEALRHVVRDAVRDAVRELVADVAKAHVLDVAERLVREEIARLEAHA